MDYDQIMSSGEMPQSIMQNMYDQYFEPYLRQEVPSLELGFFYEQAMNAWRSNVENKDIENMLFVEWICEQAITANPADFMDVLSRVLEADHDATEHSIRAERSAYNAMTSEDDEQAVKELLEQYKTYFENELRLWVTLPYYYASKIGVIKSQASDTDSYIQMSGGEKYHVLRDVKTALPKGNLPDLVANFNNKIRNAGGGHMSWEISDEGKVILHVLHPKTGKETDQFTMTIKEIREAIWACRRNLWSLRMGIMLFLTNNPTVRSAVQRNRPYKIKEMRDQIVSFASERHLVVTEFQWDKAKNHVLLNLKYQPKFFGEESGVIYGTGHAYDLLAVPHQVKYETQVLGVIQILLISFPEKIPTLSLKVSDDNDELIADLEYTADELKKLAEQQPKGYIPKPSKGTMPNSEYTLMAQMPVPVGQRELIAQLLRDKGYIK